MNKAQGLSLRTIIVAILLLVVLFVIILFFSKSFGQEASNTNTRIRCLGEDEDNDGVNDFIDQCCDTAGDVDLVGCAENQEKKRCGCWNEK